MQKSVYLSLCLALALLFLAALPPTKAWSDSPNPSLVIIDTGIDSSLPIFQNRLISEVCILDWYLCPNGSNFQEGMNAATLRGSIANINGFDHGTQMASIAVNAYPELKFIFMRVIANNMWGNRLPVTNENIVKALTWVQQNREKYNIRAVAMSQGNHQLLPGYKYCPVVPGVQKAITQLKLDGVAVFFPVGNQADKKRIDWPACIPDSIAVGAINDKDEITSYTNMDYFNTDMYALGNIQAIVPGGRSVNASGTSVSTQIAAVQWIQFANKYPQASYSQIFQALRTSGKLVFDINFRFGRKVDLVAALAQYEKIFITGNVASAA